MINFSVNFTANGITLSASEDVPRCDLTIIQIRATSLPSSTESPINPYVDLTRPGCTFVECRSNVNYVDTDHKLKAYTISAMEVINLTSVEKGTKSFNCGITSTAALSTIHLDQTPAVIVKSMNYAQSYKFTGNATAKELFVRNILTNYFTQSKTVLGQDPFV